MPQRMLGKGGRDRLGQRTARENKQKSDQILASNKTKPGVVTLPSGIQYKVVEAGAGAKPNANSTVDFNFIGALAIMMPVALQVARRTGSAPKPSGR